jgi:hypothetical protein
MRYIGIISLLSITIGIHAMEQDVWDTLDKIGDEHDKKRKIDVLEKSPVLYPSVDQVRSFLEVEKPPAITKIIDGIEMLDKGIKKMKKSLGAYNPIALNWFKIIMIKALECAEDEAVKYTILGEAYEKVCEYIQEGKNSVEDKKSIDALLVDMARQKPESILEIATIFSSDE